MLPISFPELRSPFSDRWSRGAKLWERDCDVTRSIFVRSRCSTGSLSSIYEQLFICYVTRAICIFIRICMGKITIVSVTYENEVI